MRITRSLSLSIVFFALLGCASGSGRLVDSYRAPGTISFVFERGVLFVLNGGPELRPALEAQAVATAGRSRLIAAHSALSAADLQSVPVVRRKLLDKGFDGIVTMRLIRADEINPLASQQGETFSTYAGTVSPGEPVFGEGKVLVETSVFRLSDEKLIWRGLVECRASEERKLIARDTVNVVMEHLRDTGLVHD